MSVLLYLYLSCRVMSTTSPKSVLSFQSNSETAWTGEHGGKRVRLKAPANNWKKKKKQARRDAALLAHQHK